MESHKTMTIYCYYIFILQRHLIVGIL